MLERDEIKRLFAQEPSFDKKLEEMFGEAYLDHPDLSGQVPDTMREATELIGEEVHNISELVARALETATPINCNVNQQLLRQAVEGYIAGTKTISWEETWAVRAHMRNCGNQFCHKLDRIATLDNRVTPEQMEILYEEIKTHDK